MKNVEILDELHVLGKGNIIIVKKDNYKINDVINNRYIVRGIEELGSKTALIVINHEDLLE